MMFCITASKCVTDMISCQIKKESTFASLQINKEEQLRQVAAYNNFLLSKLLTKLFPLSIVLNAFEIFSHTTLFSAT